MSGNLRRALFGSMRRRPSAGEMIAGAVLDHLTREPEREPNVPVDPSLPVELQGIIESSDDYQISRRGHHTKCWIWKKNRMNVKDPVSGRKKNVVEVVYRIYSGKELPGDKRIEHKCGQDRCINCEHFSIVKKREADVIHQIRTRADVEIDEDDIYIIRKLAKRYDWTEKEQSLIFNVMTIDLREDD